MFHAKHLYSSKMTGCWLLLLLLVASGHSGPTWVRCLIVITIQLCIHLYWNLFVFTMITDIVLLRCKRNIYAAKTRKKNTEIPLCNSQSSLCVFSAHKITLAMKLTLRNKYESSKIEEIPVNLLIAKNWTRNQS